MNTLDFLKYLNLALKQSDLSEEKQDKIWFDVKSLLDSYTLEEVQEKLSNL